MKFLTDFRYKRGILGAIGFYISYLLIFTLVVSIAVAIIATIFNQNIEVGVWGAIASSIISPILCFVILRAKGLSKNVLYILISAASFLFGYYKGAVFGFLPVAFFTMLLPTNHQ